MENSAVDDNPNAKAERFIRIAEQRTNKIITAIEILQQLSNKNNYEYTDDQRTRIFRAIRSAVNEADNAFKGVVKDKKRFKF